MKANELRIGNLVNGNDTVVAINWDYKTGHSVEIMDFIGGTMNVNIDRINPIPLTEELLLRFGFQLATDSYKGYLSPKFRNNQKIRVRVSNSGNLYYSSNNSTSPLWIDSAHQLMNLYFALTGEELCLKP